jgi:type II secretory pathway pseudopilin PulG
MMQVKKTETGFTIIELLLAMAFLAFILVFVVSATIQLFQIYNKGGVMKQINQSGRSTIEEMGRSFRSQNLLNVSIPANAKRICSNDVAYVWNTLGGAQNNKFDDNTNVNFVRIDNAGSASAVCTPNGGGFYPDIDKDQAVPLISPQLVVNELEVKVSPADRKLMSIKLALSTTGDNSPVIVDSILQCPAGVNGQFCAMTRFETIVYAPNTR